MLDLGKVRFVNKKVLLDECAISTSLDIYGGSLLLELYSGRPEDLLKVDSKLRDAFIRESEQIASFFSINDVAILPEVLEENNVFTRYLNGHYTFFKERMEKRHFREWKMIEEDHRLCLENLHAIANKAFKLNHLLKSQKVDVDWRSPANRQILEVSETIFEEMRSMRKGYEDSFKSRNEIGRNLLTDEKLAAYLILSANEMDSVLFTKDKLLIGLTRRLYRETRGLDLFSHAKGRAFTYNPDFDVFRGIDQQAVYHNSPKQNYEAA